MTTMTTDQSVQFVLDTVSGIAPDVDVATIDLDADLADDVGLDSMDVLNVMIAVHDRTGITIAERDYPRLRTVRSLAEELVARGATLTS